MNSPITFLLVFFVQIFVVKAERISLKLAGGSTAYEGNVFVKRGSDWGVVCDDEWDMQDGNVVCRQLGYGNAVKITAYNRFLSSPTEKIFLDDVKCQGYESNLGECMHREWLVNNCNAAEAAGVVCEGPTSTINIRNGPVRGQGGGVALKIIAKTAKYLDTTTSSYGQGSTTPNVESTTGPIQLSSTTPSPVRKETSERRVYDSSEYSERTRELLARVRHIMDNPPQPRVATIPPPQQIPEFEGGELSQFAVGSELNIAPPNLGISLTGGGLIARNQNVQDDSDAEGLSQTAALRGVSGSFEVESSESGSQPAPVVTREVTEQEKEKVDELIEEMKSDQPAARPYFVEVVGGRRSNEGYVKVTMDNGKTGTVCSDTWGIYEAMVVCRQAGKQRAEKATVVDYFGARNQDKVIYEIHCDGHERSLADCEYKLSDRHGVKCSKPMNVAGVVCTSSKLPDLMPNIWALQTSVRIEEKPLHSLTCAMEEGCLSSSASTAQSQMYSNSIGFGGILGGFGSGPTRRLLRFSSSIFNNGTADFRPKQHRSGWEWHSCHQHYHSMSSFSHYDILDSHGNRVAEGYKASFCLEDVECNWPHMKKYSCRGFADQGISIGCADVYKSDIDCQWIDITDLKAGAYVFKLNVNPKLEVPELSFDNNAAICELTYNGYSAKLTNCALARG